MNPVLESILTKVSFPQALTTLLNELSLAFEDRDINTDNIDSHKSIDGVSDLVFLHLTDTDLNQRFFVMVNDKDKRISFGEEVGCYCHCIQYADLPPELIAVAAAYTVKEKLSVVVKSQTDSNSDTSKYKTINFITAKKYEGMNHDTLLEGLDEVFQKISQVKNTNHLGIRLEPIDPSRKLLVEYMPSTHTLMVDGAASAAVKGLIRAKVAEHDKEIFLVFN